MCVAWGVLSSPAMTQAESQRDATAIAKSERWSAPIELVITGKSGHFNVNVFSEHTTLVWVPRGVVDWSLPEGADFEVRRWSDDTIYLRAKPEAPEDAEVGLRVWSQGYEFSFYLRASETLRGLEDSFVVKHEEDVRREAEQAALRALRESPAPMPEVALLAPEKPADANEQSDPSVTLARDRLARFKPPRLQVEFDMLRLTDESLYVAIKECEWLHDRDLLLTIEAENLWNQPFPLEAIDVRDAKGVEIPFEPVFETRAIDQEQGRIHTLSPRERMTAGLVLRGAWKRDLEGMRLEFRGRVGTHVATTANRVIRFRPVPDGDLEAERRDREARGRITLQVQPTYGAVWLANPLVDGAQGATSLTGGSVRVSYGINRLFAFEGELSGASSGSVRFDGMMFQNEPGQLTRNASIGRARLGGVVRLGHQVIPTMRLGIGFQGSNHDSRFLPTGGGDMPGPESGFKSDLFFSFGAGVDIRLGEHWMAGMDVSAIGVAKSLDTESIGGSVEAGLHVSYSWQPGGNAGR